MSIRWSTGFEDGYIRLAGGQDYAEGRVEIFHNGVWGTVCDDDWDINDAHVVCRQLCFPSATEALGSAHFGNGDGNIWMDNLGCSGDEANLFHCTFPGWGVHNCGHSEDAGVRCENGPNTGCKNADVEYALDHNASLSHQLGELFDSGRDCDLTISVVVDNNTVETICAHRVILSLNSNLQTSQPDINSLRLDVTYECREHANTVIRYFYTRKIQFTLPSVYCILNMASQWGLTELHNEAASIFRQFLPEDPTFQSPNSFYRYAVYTGDEALQEVSLRYLAWNCETLIQSQVWTSLPFDLVKALLSRSDLVVRNETAILSALERWAAAQSITTIPEVLLKLVRFPMIPAEDLYTLDSSRYHASKLQGFQFNALPFMPLISDVSEEENVYTSRIYTGPPWSFTFNFHIFKAHKDFGYYTLQGQTISTLTSDFQTPVHNGAYFAFHSIRWKTGVYSSDEECTTEGFTCSSLPAVSLKIEEKKNDLPSEMEGRIHYSNKLVVMCEGRYVFHVEEFAADDSGSLIFVPSGTEQVYPCHSDHFSYQVVVRPHYSTG
ncbi:galectin-3-binding protein A-like isoform X2 [Mugil cephalus]|nr:galectin-3-binding protein A-like isoform X2 [Mugil cephalus]